MYTIIDTVNPCEFDPWQIDLHQIEASKYKQTRFLTQTSNHEIANGESLISSVVNIRRFMFYPKEV